jgi:ADP-ribose pyrophosphatase
MDCNLMSVIRRGRVLAAANSKWNVYFDHLADELGNEVPEYLVIESPHAGADHMTGISVLPIVNGSFALLSCYRHPLCSELWEAPRGFIDPMETPVDAALRELGEETGLACSPADLIPLGLYAPEPSTMAARGALFAATRCQGVARRPLDEMGLQAVSLFTPTEMAELVAGGSIEEAGTLIAYYRYCALAGRSPPVKHDRDTRSA